MQQIHNISSCNIFCILCHVDNHFGVPSLVNILLPDITDSFFLVLIKLMGKHIVTPSSRAIRFNKTAFDSLIEDSLNDDF